MRSAKLPAGGLAFAAGYGGIVLLLVVASLQAYSLLQQTATSELQVYKSYFQVERAVVKLRRVLWQGGSYARDYFLDPSSNRHERFRQQIDEVTDTCRVTLRELGDNAAGDLADFRIPSLVAQFLDSLELIASQGSSAPAQAHELVQTALVPRRSAVSDALAGFMDRRQMLLHEQESRQRDIRKSMGGKLLVLLVTSVLLGTLVAFLTFRYTRSRERERLLHYEETIKTKQELERLSLRLLDVQEEERASLARELHDEVGQTLTALRMEISQALTGVALPTARERLERAKRLAEQTVQVVRDISLMLRPSLLDDLGLVPALQWQLESFSTRSGITVSFEGDGVPEDLPIKVRTCLYRIVQEAVHNCEKHAGATRLRVRLQRDGRWLFLEVKDNGVGFPSSLSSNGSGLLGMRERVSQLGGSFHIESPPRGGASIHVRIPMEQSAEKTREVLKV